MVYLLLLHVSGHHDHLGSRMDDIKLADDGGSIVRHEELVVLVNHHLVHAYDAMPFKRRPTGISIRWAIASARVNVC